MVASCIAEGGTVSNSNDWESYYRGYDKAFRVYCCGAVSDPPPDQGVWLEDQGRWSAPGNERLDINWQTGVTGYPTWRSMGNWYTAYDAMNDGGTLQNPSTKKLIGNVPACINCGA